MDTAMTIGSKQSLVRGTVHRATRGAVAGLVAALSLACSGSADRSDPVAPPAPPGNTDTPPPPATGAPLLPSTGLGAVSERYTSEVWVHGTTAYTSTWGARGSVRGNAVKLWDVSGAQPRLVDSVLVADAGTTGDVQVSDDGTLMLVAIEPNPNGGIALYSLTNGRSPRLLVRTTGGELRTGVHTAELARVNGVLYAFCAVDPANGVPARLVVLDLSDPANPRTVWSQVMGAPFVHDVFVRGGLLYTAEWNDGVGIWDIGAVSGSVSAPRFVSRIRTVGGQVHNVWRLYDPLLGPSRWLLVGQEGPGVIGSASSGDVHVVDLQDLPAPREVAFYNVAGAGTHNFSVDEASGLAYVAYYNAGVRVLDVRGDLAACTAAQRSSDGRCDLTRMGRERAAFRGPGNLPLYIWGVHWSSTGVFASDMLNGLWRITPATR
ncbi:MAG: hypothetical protein C0516_01580 [Gemmatimonas sp.]|nr:hypothetical protein [Gemmatimonas sp.]